MLLTESAFAKITPPLNDEYQFENVLDWVVSCPEFSTK